MIAFYISGHGFGHASRDIEVLNALGRLAPDVPVAVRTSAPKWLFDLTLTRPVDFTSLECDTGIVQIDSLSLDEAETVRRASAFHERLDALAARRGAVAAARSARAWWSATSRRSPAPRRTRPACPSIALGNFTWDWIYEGYRDWLAPGSDLIETLGDAYALADARCACRCTAASRRCARSSTCRSSRGDPRAHPRDTRRATRPAERSARWCCCRSAATGCSASILARSAGLTGYTIVVTADVTANRRANEVPSDAGGCAPCRQRAAGRRAGALRRTACATKISSRRSTS